MTTTLTSQTASTVDIVGKNRQLYDETIGPIWNLAIYEAVHDGLEFINLGGRYLLDLIAQRAHLLPGQSLLDLCSGQGAACFYLAERYACDVTGVEMNPRQMERARASLRRLEPQLAGRVHFIESNILRWLPSKPYAAAISLDSLMLIDDIQRALDTAYMSLVPRGHLAVTAIMAGHRVDDELRRYVWEEDGMINLPTEDEYGAMFRRAGFAEIKFEDLTSLAIANSEKIAEALKLNEDEIVRLQGEGAYRSWLDSGEVYLSGFREGKLRYPLMTCRRG